MAFGLLRGGLHWLREIIAECADGQMHCLSSSSMIAFFFMEWKVHPP
jgi:hypothetical protein